MPIGSWAFVGIFLIIIVVVWLLEDEIEVLYNRITKKKKADEE